MIMLTATNYTLWKPRMEDFLNCKELFDPIELKGINHDPSKALEWKKISRKTIGQIRQWIDHSVFHHVAQKTEAYVLWRKLEDMYQAKTARNKALLMRRLVDMKLKSGTSIAEHTSEFQSLVNQDALFNEEARRKDMSTDQTHALVMENRERPQGKQQRSGRGKNRGRSKGRQSDDQRSHVCYHCGLEGHMKKNCYKWLEEQGKSNSQPKNISAEEQGQWW
ncbi:Unknown protein [Striga hermonthica]|uniref:CCHC-type domain-containing protein n=1 Tax=Striga hermonthica TaxID=68872 RepID=A0A9N7NCN0_STRHE|nr:Unknown protein [Striga hermonthica]